MKKIETINQSSLGVHHHFLSPFILRQRITNRENIFVVGPFNYSITFENPLPVFFDFERFAKNLPFALQVFERRIGRITSGGRVDSSSVIDVGEIEYIQRLGFVFPGNFRLRRSVQFFKGIVGY